MGHQVPGADLRGASAHAPPPPGRHLGIGRSWPAWAAVTLAVTGTLAYVGFARARHAAYATRLPALPELSRQPAAVRAHLMQADRAARDQPMSADVVGALGLAYHADLFYDEADRSYAIAEQLSGFDWRW